MAEAPQRPPLRRRISDALVDGAFQRSADARLLEQRLTAMPGYSPSRAAALSAVRRAQRFDAMLLWIGMRLRLGRTY